MMNLLTETIDVIEMLSSDVSLDEYLSGKSVLVGFSFNRLLTNTQVQAALTSSVFGSFLINTFAACHQGADNLNSANQVNARKCYWWRIDDTSLFRGWNMSGLSGFLESMHAGIFNDHLTINLNNTPAVFTNCSNFTAKVTAAASTITIVDFVVVSLHSLTSGRLAALGKGIDCLPRILLP